MDSTTLGDSRPGVHHRPIPSAPTQISPWFATFEFLSSLSSFYSDIKISI